MTNKVLIAGSLAALLLASTAVQAEGGFKYRKLKPDDPPCLFLLDENTGQPTGDPMNTPCTLGNSTVNPGGNVNPADRAKYGKAADAASGMASGKRTHSPRDAASGMASGKRQHKPLTVTKSIDKASPKVAGDHDKVMRKKPGATHPVPPKPEAKDPSEPSKPPGT